jgi:hypothetical protein
MNTKIGTSFGLAALVVIAAIATMFALGAFSAKPASAALGATITVTNSPTTAGAAAEHTVAVTGGTTQAALTVGGTISVKFDTKYTVPSTMLASTVKLKARDLTGTSPTGNQLVSAGAITISGKVVTITVPDMDPSSTTNGDNGIAANSPFTIIFTQAAGITNPKLAISTGRGVNVKFSSDDTYVPSSTNTAITRSVTYTPSTAARGATVTVTGKGFTANCNDCKIRMHPEQTQSVVPTTGNEGSGTIDADGVFTGTIVLDSSTNQSSYIWVVDANGDGTAATAIWAQKAGATPTATSVTPGSTVTVALVDYSAGAFWDVSAEDTIYVDVGSNGSVTGPTADNTLDSNGETETLTPFKFVMPITTPVGSHKVTITEPAAASATVTKSANFNIDVVARTLSVTPNPAAIGQTITISGTGFNKGGSIDTLTGSGSANLKVDVLTGAASTITIDSAGAWTHTTTMDTINSSAGRTSDSYTITATDDTSLVGTSSGFKRTARTLTISPTTAAPGESLTVSVTGMTVDDNENSTNATFTMSHTGGNASTYPLTGTVSFPVGSDGSGTGTITVPLGATEATYTFTASDNAGALNTDAGDAARTRTAQATVKVAAGVISVEPAAASTGQTVTVSGSGFPPNTTGTVLTFGTASGIPTGGFAADASGAFSVTTEVPAATNGGSLAPGSTLVKATIGSITGTTTDFTVPNPSIVITPAEASPEDIITIEGTGFYALGAVTTLNIGTAAAIPSPAPKAGRQGEITANVEVPLLNPGTYTVVMTNAAGFTATSTFTAIAAKAPAAANTDNTETVFASVIANDDNLVRVWRFSNADQSWAFFDPRPEFAAANTLAKTGAGDIVWVNVTAEEEFQSGTLFPGWNLISLK